jgi:hypothetical protein
MQTPAFPPGVCTDRACKPHTDRACRPQLGVWCSVHRQGLQTPHRQGLQTPAWSVVQCTQTGLADPSLECGAVYTDRACRPQLGVWCSVHRQGCSLNNASHTVLVCSFQLVIQMVHGLTIGTVTSMKVLTP